MALVETAIIGLSFAVLKGLAKVAAGDDKLTAELAGGTLDTAKKLIEDYRKSSSGRAALASRAERVARDVANILQKENRTLPDNDLEAGVLAAAEMLLRCDIDADLLIMLDLDPGRLNAFILDRSAAARRTQGGWRDDVVDEVARRVLIEVSRQVVATADALPTFTSRLAQRHLERIRVLRESVGLVPELVADELERRERLVRTEEARALEERYRQLVHRKLDEVQLLGVDLSREETKHQPLSVAYVALRFSDARRKQPSHLEAKSISNEQPVLPKQSGRASQAPLGESTEVALSRHSRLLIRGDAGSGKTTLLQWIGVRSAQRSFPPEMAAWNDSVPFLIRLRRYPSGDLPSPDEFLRATTPERLGGVPAGWVEDQLVAGRAVVLVDGVDEVSEARRSEVRTWLRGLIEAYPLARFVVTSRPKAATASWLSTLGFQSADLLPLDLTTIPTFVAQWHEAVACQSPEADRPSILQLGQELVGRLRALPRLRLLATNPLLCALICALHRERKYNLPTGRVELYRACLDALANRRDPAQEVRVGGLPELDQNVKDDILRDLAHWMLENSWREINVERAAAHIESRLEKMGAARPIVSGTQILELLLHRSGVLREPEDGIVEFVHPTFLEYLAAQAIIEEGSIGALVRNATDDQWHEVIILSAGLAGGTDRRFLISELVRAGAVGSISRRDRARLHFLAAACLDMKVAPEAELRELVDARLAELVPPSSGEDIKPLAAAGDLAVQYLRVAEVESRPDWTDVLCIHALGEIGSELALEALTGYAIDSRPSVRFATAACWLKFDASEFGNRVIPVLARSGSLELAVAPTLSGLESCTGLTRLLIGDASALNTLEPIRNLNDLVELSIRNSRDIADISPVAGLRNLVGLQLNDFRSVDNFDSLSALINLESLDLDGCSLLDDVELRYVVALERLRSVALSGTSLRGYGLRYLSRLSGIESLTIGSREFNGHALSNLCYVRGLTKLAVLNIRHMDDGLRHLEFVPNLGRLSLRGSRISNGDLAHLQKAPRLSDLILWDTQVTDDGLEHLLLLPKLTSLDLDGTGVGDDGMRIVGQMAGLRKLDLRNTRVSDAGLRHLTSLSGLQEIALYETETSPDGIDELRRLLPLCQVRREYEDGADELFFDEGDFYE